MVGSNQTSSLSSTLNSSLENRKNCSFATVHNNQQFKLGDEYALYLANELKKILIDERAIVEPQSRAVYAEAEPNTLIKYYTLYPENVEKAIEVKVECEPANSLSTFGCKTVNSTKSSPLDVFSLPKSKDEEKSDEAIMNQVGSNCYYYYLTNNEPLKQNSLKIFPRTNPFVCRTNPTYYTELNRKVDPQNPEFVLKISNNP